MRYVAKFINFQKSLNDLMESGYGNLISKINQLKEEIQADRALQIKVSCYSAQNVFCRYINLFFPI